jgi:sorting nexin-1/2
MCVVSPFSESLGLTYVQALKNPPLDKNTGLQPVFSITVDDPQKVGSPINTYTMYTVHTRVSTPLRSEPCEVPKSPDDFPSVQPIRLLRPPSILRLLMGLRNTFCEQPRGRCPSVPEKNTFGRFDDQFVQQRRLALERCIQKTANHPVLQKDPDLKLFLESDTFSLDIKHRKAEIAHERGGLMASIGQSFVGPRFHETDEVFLSTFCTSLPGSDKRFH